MPAVRAEQGGQHPHRGRLARPVRAQHAEDAARGHGQIQPVQRPGRAERLDQSHGLDGRDVPHPPCLSHFSYVVLDSALYDSSTTYERTTWNRLTGKFTVSGWSGCPPGRRHGGHRRRRSLGTVPRLAHSRPPGGPAARPCPGRSAAWPAARAPAGARPIPGRDRPGGHRGGRRGGRGRRHHAPDRPRAECRDDVAVLAHRVQGRTPRPDDRRDPGRPAPARAIRELAAGHARPGHQHPAEPAPAPLDDGLHRRPAARPAPNRCATWNACWRPSTGWA